MARHPKRKAGKYGARQYQTKYDPNDGTMERALTEIRLGKKVKDIALKYKIPRSTLYDKIKDNHPKKVGRPTVLSHDEEKALASMVELTCEWQVPMDRTDLRYFVQDYLNKKGVKLFRNENLPSMDWTERFIRDFKLKLRSVDNVKPNRSGLSLEDVNKFFINLEKELDGVPPENIWNFDETNFTDDPGKKKVIVSKRRRRVERCMPHSKTSFSVMCCGNPKGEFMPPMIVYKSKCMWENWKKHGPRGASYTMSKNGWFEAQSFTKWFMDLALPRLKELTGKKVIIGDNLGCHYTADVLIECRRHNIAFIPLIPNTTHISQPLDVAVFSPVKKFWRQSLEAWRRETRIKDDLQKTCFPAILRSTFIRIERELGTALESGFRTCGIHPLDRTKIAKKIPSRVHVVDGFDLNIFNDSVLDFLENNRTCSVTSKKCEPGKNACDMLDTQAATTTEVLEVSQQPAQTQAQASVDDGEQPGPSNVINDREVDTDTDDSDVEEQLTLELEEALAAQSDEDEDEEYFNIEEEMDEIEIEAMENLAAKERQQAEEQLPTDTVEETEEMTQEEDGDGISWVCPGCNIGWNSDTASEIWIVCDQKCGRAYHIHCSGLHYNIRKVNEIDWETIPFTCDVCQPRPAQRQSQRLKQKAKK